MKTLIKSILLFVALCVPAQATVVGSSMVPPGTIISFAGANCPTGYLDADGTSELRTAYPKLFTAIGTAWGAADGTHFNRPDLRGYFMRGVDGGIARDPDRAARTAIATGGNTGDNVGSAQADQLASHNHSISGYAGGGGGTTVQFDPTNPSLPNSANTSSSGGNETRSKNVYVKFCIKY